MWRARGCGCGLRYVGRNPRIHHESNLILGWRSLACLQHKLRQNIGSCSMLRAIWISATVIGIKIYIKVVVLNSNNYLHHLSDWPWLADLTDLEYVSNLSKCETPGVVY